jgi:hypothetical protein
VDLSRPRTVREILSTALSMYGRYPALFLALAMCVIVPYELIVLAVTRTAPLAQQTSRVETAVILLLIQFALVGPLVSALYVKALVAIGNREPLSIVRVAIQGLRVLPVVAAAQIVAGIAIVLGLFLLVIPGVILALRFAVVAQVAAIEGTDWPGALRRGAELTRGNYLRILGLLACVYLVNATLTRLGILAAGSGDRAGPVVVGIVVATLTQSFQALVAAVLYFDLRARQVVRS